MENPCRSISSTLFFNYNSLSNSVVCSSNTLLKELELEGGKESADSRRFRCVVHLCLLVNLLPFESSAPACSYYLLKPADDASPRPPSERA